MSDGNTALALALGAGGGFFLWYFLREEKKDALHERRQTAHGATPTDQAARPTTAPAPSVATPNPPNACALRLDPSGLTADGVRVNVADAVTRCKAAGRAEVTIIKDAPAAAYADLLIALGREGVPTCSHRNAAASRRPRRRVAQATESVDLPESAESVDLLEFAIAVLVLGDQIDEDPSPEGKARGRFGRKVFIAAIRRALRGTKYARLPRSVVDELLIRAHRAQLLTLARADLVAAMDPDEVRDSEIVHLALAHFHFVTAERAQDNATYSHFTLAIHSRADKEPAKARWFHTEEPITWEEARDRLVAARVIKRPLFRRMQEPGGWVLLIEPSSYRADRAEPFPGGEEGLDSE